MEVGSRVGAILQIDGNTKIAQIFGYGVFEGEEIPPEESEGLLKLMHEHSMPNPKIKLDNGNTVWGCECWWASEESIQKKIKELAEKGYIIEEV